MSSSGSSGMPVPQCGCCEDCAQGGVTASEASGGADPTTGAVTGGGGPSLDQGGGSSGGGSRDAGLGGFPGGPGGGGGGFGMDLGERRTYSNLQDGNGTGSTEYGANWSDPALPRLAFDGTDVTVERGGRKNLGFRSDGGGGYIADYFIRDTLTEDGGVFTLTDTSGVRHVFDSAGLLTERHDSFGNVATYTYNNDLLESVEVTDGGSKSVEYVYSRDGSDRVDQVTLKVDGNDVRRIRYVYYSGNHNLQKAILEQYETVDEVSTWEEIETSYYGYHGSSNEGLLQYVLGHDAYERYTSVVGADLEDYADFEYAYYGASDPDGAEGQVKSVHTHGRAYHYGFKYASSAYGGGDPNTWVGKTEVTQPDGHTVHTYYYNSGRQLMLERVTDTADGSFSHCRNFQRFDDAGRAILRADPSAIDATSFSESKADLVDLKADEGLVHVSKYYDGITPSTQPAGYLHYSAVRKGETGDDVLLTEYTYEAQTVGGTTIQRRKTMKVYRQATDSAASDPVTTTYLYTYHQSGGNDTFQVKKKTTQLPAVPGSENGDGSVHTTEHHYDERGFLEKYVDELGTVTEYEYAVESGGLTKVTRNAGGTPELITDLECDALGRTTLIKGPEHAISLSGTATPIRRAVWTQYLDADHEVRTVRGFLKEVESSWIPGTINPVSIRVDHAPAPLVGDPPSPDLRGFSMTEEIEAVYGGSGIPSASHPFEQSTYRSLSQVISDKGGRRVRERLYHAIPSSGVGAVDTNYAETLFGYDSNGRQDTVTEPEGTIRKTVFDRLDRPVEERIGTDDSGGGSDNMVSLSEAEYDDDGHVKKRTLYPEGAPATNVDRVTDFTYDWRGRAIEQEWDDEKGAASRTLIRRTTYDNRGNVTETIEYKDSVTAGNRLNSLQSLFDARNRLYRTRRYGFASGSPTSPLVSERYHDAKGNVLRDVPAGRVGYTVTVFDALSRPVSVYHAYGGPQASSSGGSIDPDDIALAIVMEQTEYQYDNGGNRIRTARRLRFDDATGTGPLGTPSSTTEPKEAVGISWYAA